MPHNPAQVQLDATFFERLFLSSGFAILSCRPDGVIAAWNGAADRLFRAGGAGCLEDRPFGSILPPRDRAAADRCFRDCIETGQPSEFQTRLGDDEDARTYAVILTPVPDDEGGVDGVAAWFRDITPRLRLQQVVDKRQRLNLLGELAGAVAHHYNNLLCSIGTSVEYALNMNTMSAMRRMLRRTSEAVSRASGITQQLLAFAQADYRSSDLSDLTETFLLFFDELEPSLAQRGVALKVDWRPNEIPFTAVLRDPLRIVLSNLVNNAVEAMPGGGTLSVKLARRDADAATITILDSGGGISNADMEHLFEPFHTTKGVTGSGEARTAGLGLAVAHGLVAEMHGSISAINPSEGGARFEIVLPVGTKG